MDTELPFKVLMNGSTGWRDNLKDMHRVVEEKLHEYGCALFRGS